MKKNLRERENQERDRDILKKEGEWENWGNERIQFLIRSMVDICEKLKFGYIF
jgi:hypothetical protein